MQKNKKETLMGLFFYSLSPYGEDGVTVVPGS